MAVKQRRQDASCASDERLVWTRESAEQAVKTPNDDEERLEQMSHPKKQGDGTDDAPRKVEWTCLGLQSGYGKVLLVEGCSGTTVFPQTQRVRLVRLSLFGGPTTSISSQAKTKDKPWKTPSARAHKQTTAQATIQEALQADVSRNVRHVLEDSSGDGYRRPGTGYRRP